VEDQCDLVGFFLGGQGRSLATGIHRNVHIRSIVNSGPF